MKIVYRILILLIVFAGSLYYFGSNMVEAVYSLEKETMDMNETSIPYISLRVDEVDMNLLHGYCSNVDVLTMRESITPLSAEQTFSVVISENESVVKKVKYELLPFTGDTTIEEGAINALDKEGDNKIARISLKEPLSQDTEYIIKITLITDQSKRIYYYTRIKVLPNSYVREKLDFVNQFHTSVLDKERAVEVQKYLETSKNANNSTFAYVNINSSLDMVSYGNLDKSVVFEQIPTITEISKEQASVVLSFVLRINTTSGEELYQVNEYYRFGYTSNRVYLYNYERIMKSVFDVSNTSLAKSEFKLGITDETDIDFISNSDNSMVSFVHDHELYFYSHSENKLVQVFSFEQENTDYIRDTYDNHNIKIISMDEAGNITFMVYGYMNRGEYEGRVAIILYTYDRVLGRIEEQVYIPVNTTYEILKEEIGDFAYRNDLNIIYFSVYENIYSYNLSTETLKVVAENVPDENVIFSEKEQSVAWQERTDDNAAVIHVMNLETGEMREMAAGAEEHIHLLGMIDDNIIYGISKTADEAVRSDGTVYLPMYRIIIAAFSGEVRKNYENEGIYTVDVIVRDNVIELLQAVKTGNTLLGYEEKESDFILNKAATHSERFNVTKRVTDLMLTEYYISLNSDYAMDKLPTLDKTQNTVITKDTTVRINPPEERSRFYAYSFGSVILRSEAAGEAIVTADNNVGVVINKQGKKIWERGAKTSKASIAGIASVYAGDRLNSIQASMKMLLSYKNVNVDTSAYSKYESTLEDYLTNNLKSTVLNLTGASLEQVLYYVSKGAPVIAFKSEGKAVVITAYDSSSVTVYDPSEGRIRYMGLKEAEEKFLAANNMFYSYID